ncbi:MAG: hypothetical protein H7Z72_17260 [Bacteroidetes bacterium]|nr:hypothetical protein [Fibrella sp.]
MLANLSVRLASLLAVAVFLWSCDPRNPTPDPVLLVTATNSAATPTIVQLPYTPAPPTRNQPEYVFDWENAQYVPNPSTVTPIPVPWSDLAKRAFSDDIRYDYKKADGWEMVYSTFSSRAIYGGGQSLVLYNKYRGLLRYYFYIDSGTQNIRDHNTIVHRLVTQGEGASASPLLNFAEQPIVDLTQTSRRYITLEPQATSDKTWYAVQTELAYDPQLAKWRYETFGIDWIITSDKISSVSVNGSKPTQALLTGLHIDGTNAYDNAGSTFTGTAQLLINGSQGVQKLQTAGQDVRDVSTNLAQTTTGNLLSGVLIPPGTASSSILPLPATLQLTKPGSSAPITSPSFALPGYDNSGTLGVNPQYNEAPGVFYLESKPVITAQMSPTGTSPYVYTLDVPSVRYLFNPAVTNHAAIKNIRQEIVASATNPSTSSALATPTLYTGTSLTANKALAIIGVRVSFDVAPKNGSAPVRIIKTFKADIKPL